MTSPTTESRLLPHHRMMLLEESGLPTDIVTERGYRSAMTKAELMRLGFSTKQALAPALVIPLYNVHRDLASYSIRPDQPRTFENGKIAKYEHPAGGRMILDVPRRCQPLLKNPSVPLYVTEGAKKGDALAAQGLTTVALSGVWNWRGTNELGGKSALADWDAIALNDREVYVVFDSDVARKREVAEAMRRLKAFLESKGARVRVIYLPDTDDGSKQGVDDYFANGGTPAALLQYASDTVRFPPVDDELPVIIVQSRDIRDIAEETWKAIEQWNDRERKLYRRASRLVLLHANAIDDSSLSVCTPQDIAYLAQRAANFRRILPPQQGGELKPVPIPRVLVDDLMASPSPPVPEIRGIVHSPVFAANGSLRTEVGYDEQTFLFIAMARPFTREVPRDPSEADLTYARQLLLDEWLGDFPFARQSSVAHAIAAALTPLLRELIDGPTPLFAVDAPTQGTGKGLLTDTIVEVVSGKPAGMMTDVRGDEERKRITALLSEAQSVIVIDNVKRRLDSPNLAAVLTSRLWSDRILGITGSIRVPNRALWMATGNNLALDGEIARRTVTIRLDARVDRPYERGGFKHPNLHRWVAEHRQELLWALLTLGQHWIAQGRPGWEGRPLGSFESWSSVIGGVLQSAGIEGFLEDREELYRVADSETQDWRDFVGAWWDRHGGEEVKAADLLPLVQDQDLLAELLAGVREPTAQQLKIKLGKAISVRRDRRIGGLFIRVAGRDGHQKGTFYRLEAAEDPPHLDQPSADPPHGFGTDLNTNAEGAESAESDLTFRACKGDTPSGACVTPNDQGGGYHPPHPPHPPQLSSNEPAFPAEGGTDCQTRETLSHR